MTSICSLSKNKWLSLFMVLPPSDWQNTSNKIKDMTATFCGVSAVLWKLDFDHWDTAHICDLLERVSDSWKTTQSANHPTNQPSNHLLVHKNLGGCHFEEKFHLVSQASSKVIGLQDAAFYKSTFSNAYQKANQKTPFLLVFDVLLMSKELSRAFQLQVQGDFSFLFQLNLS